MPRAGSKPKEFSLKDTEVLVDGKKQPFEI